MGFELGSMDQESRTLDEILYSKTYATLSYGTITHTLHIGKSARAVSANLFLIAFLVGKVDTIDKSNVL